jgi:hypothetical protein
MLVYTLATVHDMDQQIFKVSDKVDPETGRLRVIGVSRITQPGTIIEYSEAVANVFLACGAARLLTAEETQLHRLTQRGI